MTSFGVCVNQKQWLQEFMFITEVVRLGVDRPGDSNFSFTDDERRTLVDAAMAMGKDLMEQVVTIVKPKTILAWQRKLEKQKWDYSDRRKNNPVRPRIAIDKGAKWTLTKSSKSNAKILFATFFFEALLYPLATRPERNLMYIEVTRYARLKEM